MAITTNAICDSFKKELLQGSHDFDANGSGGDTFKLAMYTSSATLGKSTANYSTNPGGGSNTEVTSPSGYTAGGKALVNSGVKVSSSIAITDYADLSFQGVTLTARGALIYNTQTNGGSNTTDAVAVLDFGGDKTATSGTFTIQFPAFTTSAAILRIA
tara:strand:- start:678 stop:1151 length:474 start_codon:yes stop_codon:yes gene_type:complete